MSTPGIIALVAIVVVMALGAFANMRGSGTGNWAEDLGQDLRSLAIVGLILFAGLIAIVVLLAVELAT